MGRLALLLAALWGSGCVTLYQPQRAIHRPVVIERAASNFAGLRVLVRCNAHEDHLPVSKASELCGKLSRDLEQQGAETEWVVPYGASFVEPRSFDGAGADLTIEIESKIDHQYAYPLSLYVACLTCTVIPTIEEWTFSQRVVVIGRDRSVLAEELFRERFVDYTGCAVWSINYLLDWLVRDKANAVSGDAPKEDFSRDFYGQIRQLAFNARVRGEILGLIDAPSRTRTTQDAEEPSVVDDAGSAAPSGAGAGAADEAKEPDEVREEAEEDDDVLLDPADRGARRQPEKVPSSGAHVVDASAKERTDLAPPHATSGGVWY